MRSHVFSLCPDSHFAHEQFRNCTAQSKTSYFARKSENSGFLRGQFRIFAQNIYMFFLISQSIGFSIPWSPWF